MTLIKALRSLVTFGIFCLSSWGDELAVSSATIIETPPLTHLAPDWRLYGGVAVSGTNAVFIWNRPGEAGTNLLLTHLTDTGRPVEAPPQFVTPLFYTSGQPQLLPAANGFFIGYFDRTNQSSQLRFVATLIDSDGKPAFPPITISTNNFKAWRVASNGRSFLLLVEDYLPTGITLVYTLIDQSGALISRGVLPLANGGHEFAVGTDGTNYLAFWPARANPFPTFQGARIHGDDGSVSFIDMGTNIFPLSSMRYGKNGYLLAGDQRIVQIDANANVIAWATNNFLPISAWSAIYPDREGWVVFNLDRTTGTLRSLGVTPTPNGLKLTSDPYPTVTGLQYGTYTPPVDSAIAPFGAERFLVARENGVSVLTKTGATPAVFPPMFARQTDSEIVASPFGYLVEWTEHRDLGYSIRGLRFAPDGSPLDDHSFEIGTFYEKRTYARSAVFDGEDYVVEWNVLTAPVSVARISPQGAPDVRLQSYAIDTRGGDVYLIAQKGDLFLSRGAATQIVPDVHIWKLAPDGQVSPDVVVHGYGAFSDGANLFSLGVDDVSDIYKIAIDPEAPNPEISSNLIVVASASNFAQLRHGFVVQWFDRQASAFFFSYFSNGQEARGPAPRNIVRAFADSDDRLLMASLPPLTSLPQTRSRLSRFNAVNLQTGAQSSAEADVGNVTDLHVASYGTDFLGVTEALNSEMQYVGKFWITTTKPPAFTELHINQDTLATTTLNLNPTRRYRIETSSDLINWNLRQVVSGSTTFNFTLPGDPQQFARAILVPE